MCDTDFSVHTLNFIQLQGYSLEWTVMKLGITQKRKVECFENLLPTGVKKTEWLKIQIQIFNRGVKLNDGTI